MGLFKPAWQSEDEQTALAAIDAITDPYKLCKIVKSSRSKEVIKIASAKKITDQGLLRELYFYEGIMSGELAPAVKAQLIFNMNMENKDILEKVVQLPIVLSYPPNLSDREKDEISYSISLITLLACEKLENILQLEKVLMANHIIAKSVAQRYVDTTIQSAKQLYWNWLTSHFNRDYQNSANVFCGLYKEAPALLESEEYIKCVAAMFTLIRNYPFSSYTSSQVIEQISNPQLLEVAILSATDYYICLAAVKKIADTNELLRIAKKDQNGIAFYTIVKQIKRFEMYLDNPEKLKVIATIYPSETIEIYEALQAYEQNNVHSILLEAYELAKKKSRFDESERIYNTYVRGQNLS